MLLAICDVRIVVEWMSGRGHLLFALENRISRQRKSASLSLRHRFDNIFDTAVWLSCLNAFNHSGDGKWQKMEMEKKTCFNHISQSPQNVYNGFSIWLRLDTFQSRSIWKTKTNERRTERKMAGGCLPDCIVPHVKSFALKRIALNLLFHEMIMWESYNDVFGVDRRHCHTLRTSSRFQTFHCWRCARHS